MALLRPILHAVYGRERDESMGAAGTLGVADALADVTAEDLAPLLAGSATAMEELARAHVLEAVGVLLEDAVCTLRRKSRDLAERERSAGAGMPKAAGKAAEQAGGKAAGQAAGEAAGEAAKPASTTPWLDREPSWRVRAVLDAMALPRELADVPDTLYWAATLIEACETAVAYAPSRLVAAAVLRRLADHERALDASLAILERGAGGAKGRKKAAPADAPQPLDNPALTYCPPDPRRVDPEALAIARKVLARGTSDLAQGKVDVALRAPSMFGAAASSFMPAAGAEMMQQPVLPTRGFLASNPGPVAGAAASAIAASPAPLPAAIRELVIPPRPEQAGAAEAASPEAATSEAAEGAEGAALSAQPASAAIPAAAPAAAPPTPAAAPPTPAAAPPTPATTPPAPAAAPPAPPAQPPAPPAEEAEVQDLMRDIL